MIGIFGGTFDPVHFGHLRAASEVKEKLGIEDFRLLPARLPPHRERTYSTPEQRLAMLRLAVRDHPDLAVDERELARSGPSWMVDTLGEIRAQAVDQPMLLIIGQDSANHLDTWHRWQDLFELAHIVVMERPGAGHAYTGPLASEMDSRQTDSAADLRSLPGGKVMHLPVTQLAISSTGIRQLIRMDQSPRFLLPDRLLNYLRQQRLYLDTRSDDPGTGDNRF